MSITPSGVITITTDFGHKGPFAAVMKGVILTRFAAARIIDLAHDIPPHWPPEAGFWISRSYRYFPNGTVHIAIVDPGVGTDRQILLAEVDGHVFLAPDNGLLAPLLVDGKLATTQSNMQSRGVDVCRWYLDFGVAKNRHDEPIRKIAEAKMRLRGPRPQPK
jgi:S-adenosylmethionine hydrolase